mmetsp:Transcript_24346/g.53296  ORF Transcript_24346/g.53296 Transcript_24346/m.53296 type:complete len:98 (+) Transcript_24346:435-728(+)
MRPPHFPEYLLLGKFEHKSCYCHRYYLILNETQQILDSKIRQIREGESEQSYPLGSIQSKNVKHNDSHKLTYDGIRFSASVLICHVCQYPSSSVQKG